MVKTEKENIVAQLKEYVTELIAKTNGEDANMLERS